MALEKMPDDDRDAIYDCLQYIYLGNDIEDDEFYTRLGVTRLDVKRLIDLWPKVDDSDPKSVEAYAIGGCIGAMTDYHLIVLPSEWSKHFRVPRREISRIFRDWRTLQGFNKDDDKEEFSSDKDLRMRYNNKAASDAERIEAYKRYWDSRIGDAEPLSDDDVYDLLEHSPWSQTVSNVLILICQREMLSDRQILLLLNALPRESIGSNHLRALREIRGKCQDWQTQLDLMLQWNVLWAARRIINVLSEQDLQVAASIIQKSIVSHPQHHVLLELITLIDRGCRRNALIEEIRTK